MVLLRINCPNKYNFTAILWCGYILYKACHLPCCAYIQNHNHVYYEAICSRSIKLIKLHKQPPFCKIHHKTNKFSRNDQQAAHHIGLSYARPFHALLRILRTAISHPPHLFFPMIFSAKEMGRGLSKYPLTGRLVSRSVSNSRRARGPHEGNYLRAGISRNAAALKFSGARVRERGLYPLPYNISFSRAHTCVCVYVYIYKHWQPQNWS